MEVHAKEKLKKVSRSIHKKCKFQESEMLIDKQHPFLSASPDIERSYQCCRDFSVEIKCRYSISKTTPSAEKLSYLQKIETLIALK